MNESIDGLKTLVITFCVLAAFAFTVLSMGEFLPFAA